MHYEFNYVFPIAMSTQGILCTNACGEIRLQNRFKHNREAGSSTC